MLVVDSALNIVDRSIRHATALKNIQPLFRCFLLQHVFDDTVELTSVLDSKRIGDESWIFLPLGLAELVAENSIEFIIATANSDICIFRLVCSIRDDRRCSFISISQRPQPLPPPPVKITYHAQSPISHYPSFH